MVSDNLMKEEAINLINKLILKWKKHCKEKGYVLKNEHLDLDDINFNLKGNSRFGTNSFTYDYKGDVTSSKLSFNFPIMKANFEEFMGNTIPHEVAHHCTLMWQGIIKNGKRRVHHGDHWKYVMRFFGIQNAERCSNYTNQAEASIEPKGRIRTFTYKCECQSHMVTIIRHNRVKKGKSYICTKCKTKLVYVK